MVGTACCAAIATRCSRRAKKKGSGATMRAPAPRFTRSPITVPISPSLVAVAMWTCLPSTRPAANSVFGFFLSRRKRRIYQYGDHGDFRYHFLQHLQLLRSQFQKQHAHSRSIAARTVKAGDKASLNGVAAAVENNRNRWRCCLGGQRRRLAAVGHDHGQLTLRQFKRKRWQSIIASFRPSIFDRDVLAFDVTGLGQARPQRSNRGSSLAGRPATE